MKQVAILLFCIFCMLGCDESIELPGRLTDINLERHDVAISSSDSSIIVGVGADKITWYVLRSRSIVDGRTSTLYNKTYKYSDDRVKDVILYRDTLDGDWFKILKNKDGNLQVDISRNELPCERTLSIDIGGFLSMSENLVITQLASTTSSSD